MDRPPHLVIDLNEAPSPPPYDNPPEDVPPSPPRGAAPAVHAPPPPQPPPPVLPLPAAPASSSQQLGGPKEALELVYRFHPLSEWRTAPFGVMGNMPAGLLPGFKPPAPFPGEAGWGHHRPCSSCGHPEVLGGTIVCDSCDRGFHPACVRVWPPLVFTPPPPPPSGPPGARRPRAVANEEWICPECEMRGARSTLWKQGPVPLDINAAPPEEPVAVAVRDISRTNATDGAQLNEVAKQLPHFEGMHLNNSAIYDGVQFMPTFDLAHCLGMRQQFPSMDQDITADGNVSQRTNHIRRKRDIPQTSALPMFTENHEFGSGGIFMDPLFFNKAKEPSPNENRSSSKPPKFLVENSKRPRHHTVGLPVQYGDFFITSLGEIDNRTSYHSSYQIWPVGFTSYWHDRVTGSLFECEDLAQPSSVSIRELPPGNPITHKLPPELAGDVFQIMEFLGRFAEIIGLKEVPSVEQVENELIDPWPICANQKDIQQHRDPTPMNSPANASISNSNAESVLTTNEEMASVFVPVETSSTEEAAQDMVAAQTIGKCSGVVLPDIHLALLRVLFSELLSKVAIFVDPKIDFKESKSKRGRKRDSDNITKELKVDMLTANKLTWPELARRYIIAVSSTNGCMDFSDVSSREGVKLFRCLQGDGGILCGAVPGVVGMEQDALLLAEAENLICNTSANEGNKIFMMDYKDTDVVSSPGEPTSDMKTLPGWVESLEPVRKLPTNVGTRIRKCVYEALERNPPEWAKKILEHSISKEVYKGNASGPTKKAVLNVLAEACHVKVPQNPEKPRKEKNIISISEAILKKCRIALRRAISSDESKLFGNLLGTTLTNSNENEDDGILGFPGMVSRPLDFRTIDIRLAMGAYRGSWEAFLDDVQEVIRNLHTAFGDRPDLLEMVVRLSQNFETLYKTEVLELVQKFDKYLCNENANSEINDQLLDILTAANNMPKAPWEVGVCKVCGIDRDDDNVLLCDKCDSEYHTYCLNPPLPRVPRGNWYCPSCVSGEKRTHPDHSIPDLTQEQKQHVAGESQSFCESLNKLAMAMEEREYWELSIPERIDLLKFLCDEMLSTALVREHLDQCLDKSGDLQQKFRSWNYELKELKYKVDIRTSCARQNKWTTTENLSNSPGLAENQQRGISSVSGNLEEVERVNIGVNLNHPADGAAADNDISSTSIDDGNKSLGLSKQSSGVNTDRIDEGAIGEGSQSCEKSLGGTVINAENVESPDKNAGTFQDSLEASTTKVVDNDADNNEMNILLGRISQLQESIKTVESQLTRTSLRRECLGKDSIGRLYWVITRPGKRPYLVADGSMLIPKYRDISMVSSYPQSTFDCRGWNSASVVMYESDDEIKCLVEWLRDFDPRERELKDSILLWQRLLYLQASCSHSDPPASKFSKNESPIDLPNTKAFLILEQKYGPLLDQDTSELSKRQGKKAKSGSEERTYRCDCFEPIWPSRYHCSTCHDTYLTSTEYEEHNGGKCNGSNQSPNESKENDEPKVKGTKSDTKEKDTADNNCSTEPTITKKLEACPYDFEEICRKFITNDSNKETVKEIGLIGSNGVPSFVPSSAFFLDPPALQSQDKRYDDNPKDWTSSLEECQTMSEKIEQDRSRSGHDCPGNSGDEQGTKSRKPASNNASVEEASSATDKPTRLLAVNGGLIPESSLRPVIGRNSHILKQLKINLLDVEAALPEEALKSSKSQQIRRRSWRAFVKDAESISQVVLATNFLEGMIKAEFLKNDWWYWSSFTAAVKTPTISSLALRIYTLDDCIIYMKDPTPNTEAADNAKPVNKAKRRKETESSVS
ncbi:hypothetical protein QOZ80_2BG0158090 [Eleusine coracana subsp. coracana]|nr:hypothetical protein QOZ80_2BG0158090 [Eleusine coracana subsp. coracana]